MTDMDWMLAQRVRKAVAVASGKAVFDFDMYCDELANLKRRSCGLGLSERRLEIPR